MLTLEHLDLEMQKIKKKLFASLKKLLYLFYIIIFTKLTSSHVSFPFYHIKIILFYTYKRQKKKEKQPKQENLKQQRG